MATDTITATSGDVIEAPLLLPVAPPRFGPKSRRLLARFVGAVLVVELLAAILVFVAGGHRARAAGLSLAFPGGGFLYDAAPILFLVTVALAALAVVLWWGMSAHLAIPLVWLAGVAGAVALADGPRLWTADATHWEWAIPVVYALALVSAAVAVWRVERRYRAKRAAHPGDQRVPRHRRAAGPDPRAPTARRHGRRAAAMVPVVRRPARRRPRWPRLGRAVPRRHAGPLPAQRADLGDVVVRRQLRAERPDPSRAGAALDRAQAHRPARVAVLADAQPRRQLRPGPGSDPARQHHVLGVLRRRPEHLRGGHRVHGFDEPGSLTFVWKDGRSFPYDHHSIVAAVRANFQRSKLGFFPCEPGWSFTVCNIMGAQALKGHDTTHGTDLWDQTRDGWQRTLDEEYHTPDGSYAHIRSNHVGLSWDTGEVPGGHYFAQGTHRFADILPEHARRAKALDLRGCRAQDGGAGRHGRGRPDRRPRSAGRAGAQPRPDQHVAALDQGDRRPPRWPVGRSWPMPPCARPPTAAPPANAGPDRQLDVGGAGLGSYMLLRWSAPLDLAALNMRGYVPPSGPIVTDGPWDDVMVLLARSTDARSLDLQLEPFAEDATVDATLAFATADPGWALRARRRRRPRRRQRRGRRRRDRPRGRQARGIDRARPAAGHGTDRWPPVIFNCNREWSRLLGVLYRIRRKPIYTPKAPRARAPERS